MKAWEIVGWMHDGALYHDGCEPDGVHDDGDEASPVFASELSPDAVCDRCLHDWLVDTKPEERGTVPEYVFLTECSNGLAGE